MKVGTYMKVFKSSKKRIDKTGLTIVTKELQELIDETASNGGILILEKGIYQTAALFLKSNMEFHFEEGAVLLGTTAEDCYPLIHTRVAGIEMDWYPGILNCNYQHNVKITGNGVIDGQGEYWWRKYWGANQKGGMRRSYDCKGLRFACDYDCKRVRNMVIMESSNIDLQDFTSKNSGFWNIHLLYSNDVYVNNVTISSGGADSPSTDGIDIDSCYNVLIENCKLCCNDDSICIKSGRDSDGLRINRPCHNITINNCQILAGFGVTIGSEVSGGVYDIVLRNLKYHGTDCGFRIKSSKTRKGYIKNVLVENVEMVNVKYLFHIFLNWNRAYNLCVLPQNYQGEVPKHWETLLSPVSESLEDTKVSDIVFRNIKAFNEASYEGISRAFHIEGFPERPIEKLFFDNVSLECKELGVINYAKDIIWKDTKVSFLEARNIEFDEYDNR